MNFFGEAKMKTREDKRMVKLGFYSIFSFCGHILEKPTHSLCGAQSFLLVHIRFTPSEEAPKALSF
jgi:hypothetical protein